MQILAFFTNSGNPATGLSPTIRIREVPVGTLLVNDAAMSEVGDGHYSYDFTTYDYEKDYAIRCDGGATLSNGERYTYAGNENYVDDIDQVIDNNIAVLSVSASIQETNTNVLSASASIHTKLDEIKSDIQTVNTNVLGVSADVAVIDGKVDSVILISNTINTNLLAVSATVNDIYTNTLAISAAVGSITASASVDVNAIATAVWSQVLSGGKTAEQILAENNQYLKRILGLTHENIYIDSTVYDSDGNLIGARVRIYSDAASVGTANNVLASYEISAPSSAPGRFTTWKQVKI